MKRLKSRLAWAVVGRRGGFWSAWPTKELAEQDAAAVGDDHNRVARVRITEIKIMQGRV